MLCKHEFAPSEILPWFGKKNRNLYGKDVIPVEVLMKAVVVPGGILEEQRSRSLLPCIMASLDEVNVALWITYFDAHCFVPAVCDRRESMIKRGAKAFNERG